MFHIMVTLGIIGVIVQLIDGFSEDRKTKDWAELFNLFNWVAMAIMAGTAVHKIGFFSAM